MEGQATETPLKVCQHCSVASRTDAETCPNCGKPYVRRRGLSVDWQWSWWFTIPIVAGAFLLGLFVIGPLIRGDDSDEAAGITLEQAAAVPDDVTRSELPDQLDGQEPALSEPRAGNPNVVCEYYLVTDQAETVWEFCFRGDELTSSAPLGGAQAPLAPPEGG